MAEEEKEDLIRNEVAFAIHYTAVKSLEESAHVIQQIAERLKVMRPDKRPDAVTVLLDLARSFSYAAADKARDYGLTRLPSDENDSEEKIRH